MAQKQSRPCRNDLSACSGPHACIRGQALQLTLPVKLPLRLGAKEVRRRGSLGRRRPLLELDTLRERLPCDAVSRLAITGLKDEGLVDLAGVLSSDAK